MKPKFDIGDMIVEDVTNPDPIFCLIIGFDHNGYLLQYQEEPSYYANPKFIDSFYKKVEAE